MKKRMKRFLSAFLSAVVIATSITPVQLVHAKTDLVNVATKATVIAEKEDTTWGGTKDHLNDGDDDNHWAWPASNEWPVTVGLDLQSTSTKVSKVVVKLGGGDVEGRTVDVAAKYAKNGITSDLQPIGTKNAAMGSTVTFQLDQAVEASDIYITLDNPKYDGSAENITFWPSIREIEVYEEQEVKLSDYNNIAGQAQITTDGTPASDGPSTNLVDGDDGSLYKFENGQMSSEKYVLLTYEAARAMDAFRIAFEHVGDSDEYAYKFSYSILARNGASESWDQIKSNASANRTDNWEQSYQFDEKEYTEVKIVMHSCKSTAGDGWPAIAEFEVYGNEVKVEDTGSIAYGKPVHASSDKSHAKYVTDGSKNTAWTGTYYPAYVDIDLEDNYYLDTVEVYTPEEGYSQYSIYTSMDGSNFDKLAEKTSKDSATLNGGECYSAEGKEARYIRVYMEYNSAASTAVINEIRATGAKSGTEKQKRPEISIASYEDSEYANASMTAQDTYDEVYGIIERRLGEAYKDWFSLELAENPKEGHDYDYFELTNKAGKIHVKGNDGVSLAMGINHYLKYYCQVNISQVGDQVTMPKKIVAVNGTIFKETKAKVRYSYNYCTLSYSMAFWGEEEWRDELDWLALNGVNVVLDATAQEEVWRRFLGKLGYEHEDIKDFIAGPAYYAWAYMANLSGFGGPVHDSWFTERTELARKNQLSMRRLGMQPVLQGYSGMVPTDIKNYDPNVEIIEQGTWNAFQRPAMLVTTSAKFDEYAELFYKCQAEVYGTDNHYYATDPFHEGGNTGGMNAEDIAEEVLTSMLKADKNATWIIQAWQGNPSTSLLNGIDRVQDGAKHALILDLYAEKTPHYQETGSSYGDTNEFDDTPWVFCMLNNFGGRLGLHGHLDNLANNIPTAFNECEYIAGIGIAPEASVNNPVLYDFVFETVWVDDATKEMKAIDLDTWLADYATRRYGAESESAQEAWTILKDTVYKASLNNLGQGAPESVVNARPGLNITAASTWGNAVIKYEKTELEKAAALLLKDYDTLKNSEGYLYDVANVLQQVLSNSAQEYHKKMASAFQSGDLKAFNNYADKFLAIIDDMESVTSTSEYFLLGRWVEQAKALAKNADDFTKDLYEINAKALITTWGSVNQSEIGALHDYSNRQWSGLIGDFYKVRWKRQITAWRNQLEGNEYESNINWFQWEWEWVRSNEVYPSTAADFDLEELGNKILSEYSLTNEAADDSNDVAPQNMTVFAENYQTGATDEGDPDYVLDGKSNTIWHTQWTNTERNTQYLIFTLKNATKINGMRFLQRQSGNNGVITKYQLLVREDENAEWTSVVEEGALSSDTSWQKVTFNEEVTAKQIKFQVVDAKSDDANKYASAAEIRFTTSEGCEHVYDDSWETVREADCSTKGLEKRVCKKCQLGEQTRTTDAKGHQFGEWISVDEATEQVKGVRKHVCGTCQFEEYQFETSYQVIEGKDDQYRPDEPDNSEATNTDGTYTIRANGSYDEFVGVELNGETVDPSSYETWEGSTYVKFSKEFMENLSIGKHAITVLFEDGKAQATVTIPTKETDPTPDPTPTPDKKEDAPKNDLVETAPAPGQSQQTSSNANSAAASATTSAKTGDSANIGLWAAVLVICGCAAFVAVRRNKKKEQ